MAAKGSCPYAVHKKQGIKEWFVCNIDNRMCPFIRFCPNEHIVHLTREATTCRLKLGEIKS